ncbi:adenosylcobinamide-GDP ribazoletransferase [uncultured Bilophila sp.]|uniref:adenosylcobinamide-GDP ribazoletransferase n=1 Tax=uncultured Bilophila sp. TaxID=529385 RepID=UPI0026DC3D30|nr:adenosylcobinamide-GDP ribazoletransferase [uncultured Bilophila sp.]
MKLRAALGFFTRLPIGSAPLPPTFRGVIVWLPAVGLIVGAVVAAAVKIAGLFLPAALCGVIGCLTWVAVTGGLHLDGVADCGDGLIVEATRERRLEIMKDSRLGTFGGTALFFVLAFKIGALAELAGTTPDFVPLLLGCCLAGCVARCMVFVAMRVPTARPGGLGEALHEGVTARHEAIALGLAVAVAALNGMRGLLALGAAALVGLFLLSAARKRLGGVTGDVFGCLVELTECAVLTVCCITG